ncbi:condensation domain-containing protein, partial [Aetokthonos hydrillicola]
MSLNKLGDLSQDEKRQLLVELLQKNKTRIRILPLSFAQQRLWFLDQLIADNPAYNIPEALKLSGSLNVNALEQSLKQLVQRHESLRTTYTIKDGNPVQVIASDLPLKLAVVNLQNLSENEREREVQRLISLEAKKPFDLSIGPLIRVLLFSLAKEEHILFLNLHHIIADGWSLGLFNRELGLLYDANCSNQPFPLPELPIQYADFAVWQREWLQGEVLESQLSYWKNHLSGLVPLELASDRIRPPIQTFKGGVLPVEIAEELFERLKVFSKKEDVTLYMCLLAVFGTLLYRYSHSLNIAIGSPIANRNRREIEGLIGFFVNTLVMKLNFSGNPTFKELLRRVREVTRGAYAHQDLPFEKLVDEFQRERDLSRNPLVQVLFALQNAPLEALKLNHLTITPLKYEFEYTRFDLELHLWEDSKVGISPTNNSTGLSGNFFYNADIFDQETIVRMFKHFQTLLHNVLVNPDEPLWQIPIMSEEEQQILGGNNFVEETQVCSLKQLFENQVNRTPDSIALIFGDKKWTYQELNEQANQLAHYFVLHGAKPETRIGIFLERSANMVKTMLGILKAGGAYVCLDTSYPQERLRYMLTSSGLDMVVSQQELLEKLPLSDIKVCCLDDEQDIITTQSSENIAIRGSLDNLLYIVYTSGSTGQPKGIAMSHRSFANLIAT